jgi:hypothetical protein
VILTLTPAYGRDYLSAKDAIAAWHEGKDFCLEPSGVYTSVRDLPQLKSEYNARWVNIRYKSLSRVAVVKVD